MNYVYDILVNLSNKKSYEFYEWRDNDNIYHIRKVPIFKISNEQFLDIKKNNILVDKNFLNKIKNKTEVYKDLNVGYINYLCVFACDLDVIVVEFNKDGYSISKSNMLLEEADDTLYEVDELDVDIIDYKIIDINFLCSLDNTRYEEEVKNFINSEINYLAKTKDYTKLKYLYYEWYKEKSSDIKKIVDSLRKILNIDYSDKHDTLFDIIKLSNGSM